MIDTDGFSRQLRHRAIDPTNRRILVTDFRGSLQAEDLTEPINCSGVGRIRHFHRISRTGWCPNPLPLDPASRALGITAVNELRAQVFQNAACNWRCWYCFVDFPLLSADLNHSRWLSAADLVDLYLSEPGRPSVIDLTGGQPDLVPEWPLWIMQELVTRGIADEVYVWSDDNLSNDYFWQFLNDADRDLLLNYKLYGKVGCFKGFNATSFSFNTNADARLFDRQFLLMERLITLGLDQYAYVTFTTPSCDNIERDMSAFVDRLQSIDHNLPLRTIPLEIQTFTPNKARIDADPLKYEAALSNQWLALEAWLNELARRFSAAECAVNIAEVELEARSGRR